MSEDRQTSPRHPGRANPAPASSARPAHDEFSDNALLSKVASGSQDAFRSLIECHLSAVVAVALNLLGDRAEADDISQETFLRLWKAADGLDIGEAGVRPWLRRVARNLAIDHLRRQRRLEDRDEMPEQPVPATQHGHIDAQDRTIRVRQAIDLLPDRQRVALMLFHFEALSQAEIAEKMDASQDAVESLLARARRSLKAHLASDWRELIEGSDE